MELNVPYYHHELVKRALVMAADDTKSHDAPLLLKLLAELASSGAVNQVGTDETVFPKRIRVQVKVQKEICTSEGAFWSGDGLSWNIQRS